MQTAKSVQQNLSQLFTVKLQANSHLQWWRCDCHGYASQFQNWLLECDNYSEHQRLKPESLSSWQSIKTQFSFSHLFSFSFSKFESHPFSFNQLQTSTRGMCTLWWCRSTTSLPGITFRVTCSAWGSDMKYIYNGRTDSRIFRLKCSWCSSRHAT